MVVSENCNEMKGDKKNMLYFIGTCGRLRAALGYFTKLGVSLLLKRVFAGSSFSRLSVFIPAWCCDI